MPRGTWDTDRASVVEAMTSATWTPPGAAARALAVCRSTVHNYMGSGRLSWTRLGGSRLRSVYVRDVLILVLGEIEDGERLGSDMGACSRELAAKVRDVVKRGDT